MDIWSLQHRVQAPRERTVELILPPLHDGQKPIVYDPHRIVVAAMGSKFGKCLSTTTPILTAAGKWTTMGDLAVGDRVFGDDGQPTKITYVSPTYFGNTCYRVTFSDGSDVVADADHLWCVRDNQHSHWQLKTTQDLIPNATRWHVPPVALLVPDLDVAALGPRAITSIEQVDSVPVKCIAVDNASHLFLAGHSLIPTHNTFCLAEWITLESWNNYQSVNRWIAPTYPQAKIAMRQIALWLPRSRRSISKTDHVIELLRTDGSVQSRMEFRSADNEDGLRGEGVHACVMDEAAFWDHSAYVAAFTTLTRTMGKIRIISTPKGHNFFWSEWLKGTKEGQSDPKNAGYAAYQLPTWINPTIRPEAIEQFRNTMPADVFRQEICAEFLEEGAGVFKNIRACACATKQDKPVPGHQYVLGCDFGKHQDYTVFTYGDMGRKEVVNIERYTGLDWNTQIDKLIRAAKAWNNAYIICDQTGVGDVPFDAIRAVYPRIEGYNICNNQAKVALVQKLQLALERQTLKYIPHPDLIKELDVYGFEISPRGNFIFGAPEGLHDDCVISLALTWWVLAREQAEYRLRKVSGI